jgi:hypothetical protein
LQRSLGRNNNSTMDLSQRLKLFSPLRLNVMA